MKSLLKTCESYGNLWRIKLNPEKSQEITLGKALIKEPDFKINNEYIDAKRRNKNFRLQFQL